MLWVVCAQICSNSLLSVTPSHGRVAAESVAELDVHLTIHQEGSVATVLEVEVRGNKPLRLPIRYSWGCPCNR
jgi:hypothetical protein